MRVRACVLLRTIVRNNMRTNTYNCSQRRAFFYDYSKLRNPLVDATVTTSIKSPFRELDFKKPSRY